MKQIKNTFKLKSHAKINLTFEVLGKKTKYLHEIIGVFQTIDLHDEILFKSSSSILF
jgi:4-diphosphocytidyl-2-C-methyl-D-erythritol kinase